MSKLLKMFRKNSVLHFWGSYLLVLFLPIFIITVGILGFYSNMSAELKNSNRIKMEHSVSLIEGNLSALYNMAVQSTSSSVVKKNAVSGRIERDNILAYKDVVDTLSSILMYQEQRVGFVKDYYIYFNNSNYCIYSQALYKESVFDPYLIKWGIDKEKWKENIVADNITASQFVRCNGTLHYIMPVNTYNGYNDGMIVFIIDTEDILSYFDYAQEIGSGILYVLDGAGNILLSNDDSYSIEEMEALDLETIQKKYSHYSLLECSSSNGGWEYYFWITDNVAEKKTIQFLVLALLVEIVIIMGCIYISLKQAKKMGRPIDQMFELVVTDTQKKDIEAKTTEKLGEIVAGIVSTNQEMQKEIQESRPLLRKAFFHDLLTLDVTSTKELEYIAQNAGININSDEFWVVSVRLFSNNDVYDVDEQTLEDVKVIIRSMQKYIEGDMGPDVWFYQRNYLSLLILIDGQNREQIIKVVKDTYTWLLNVFSTESVWGISTKCSNIMNVWKHFEEAETAREYCSTNRHIVEYSEEVNNKDEFYFPETAEQKIINYINAGDMAAIRDVLAILEHENLINRRLNRKGYIKLNNKICEMISEILGDEKSMPYIMKLNHLIVGNEVIKEGQYFSVLEKVFRDIVVQSKQLKGQRSNEFVEKIQEYIELNYSNPDLGLAMVSVAFGISEGYVSSLFKRQTQIGFGEYIEKVRMSKALDLLKEGNEKRENIDTIATKVGYNSVQSFRRAFTRVYGTSPKNYR